MIKGYIDKQPETIQLRLTAVYQTIKNAIPDTEEKISYGIPTFWKGRNIIHFAGYKNHIGLYPGPGAIVQFEEELKSYKITKGTIQFPHKKELPLSLIEKIALWCYENYQK